MPLQIRRGTEAERQTLTSTNGLVVGELLYVADAQRLYIGTGVSGDHKGIAITGYTNEDAQDAIAPMFTGGTHTAITFAYDDNTAKINATVNLSNYQGVIEADGFIGSIFADSSTTMIDSLAGVFNLNGTVATHIIPNADVTYDLGSSTYKFRDLYLSGSSIHLGNAIITSSGSAVDLPAGSTINGAPLGLGTGSLVTDIKGSVFGDNSSIIIDGLSNTVSASSITLGGAITINGTSITNSGVSNVVKFDDASIDVFTSLSSTQPGISSTGITNGAQSSSLFSFYGSRGTTTVPTTVNSGDAFSAMFFLGHNGTDYVGSTAMFAVADGVPNSANDSVPGKIVIATANGTDDIFTSNKQMSFDSKGVLVAPVMQTGLYADNTARDAAIVTPVAGMIILNGSTFQGYNGSTWVTLG